MYYRLAIPTLFVALLTSGCTSMRPFNSDNWYRGNTHAHTVLCGHADSSPDVVAAWYHDHGYNFLILSEHNHFIDPDSVNLPIPRRSEFILIPGEEVSGQKHIHTTAMNTRKYVEGIPLMKQDDTLSPGERHKRQVVSSKEPTTESKTEILQRHVDHILNAEGLPILNHPNWASGVQPNEILPVKRLHLLELYNGHPSVNNWGIGKHVSVEEKWDSLLTAGMLVFGISSDDAHHFQTIAQNKSNPGRGWVMVQSSSLDPDSITKAMRQGDFYASNGVFLEIYNRGPGVYRIEVDSRRTKQELASLPVLRGKLVDKGAEGYRIEFIGPGGEILDTIKGQKGRFKINRSNAYVRAKVTFTRKHPQTNRLEEYYAWGQPVFTDARVSIDAPNRIK